MINKNYFFFLNIEYFISLFSIIIKKQKTKNRKKKKKAILFIKKSSINLNIIIKKN
jgi:hypothetical protein